MTVVGPELPAQPGRRRPLCREGPAGRRPDGRAARLESSKAFAKAFMARHGVPTARFRTLRDGRRGPRVRGLGRSASRRAEGGRSRGRQGRRDRRRSRGSRGRRHGRNDGTRRFGDAGARLVVEECLTGPEVSFFVLCDGDRAVPIGSAQDHKRVFDDDRGPNTGGMGAFAPSPLVDDPLQSRVMREIVEPVVGGMAAEGHPFRGFLYVGLMLTADRPEGDRVQRATRRSRGAGDPAARSAEPLLPLLLAAATGRPSAVRVSSLGRCDRRRRARVARLSGVVRIGPADHRDRRRGARCRA